MDIAEAQAFLASIPYIPASRQGEWFGTPTLLVVHDMEAAESSTTAENAAGYASRIPRSAPATSWNYSVDDDSVVCSVKPGVEAYHAAVGYLNRCSIGTEHAGFADQTREEWLDDYSYRMLWGVSAQLHAALSLVYHIPIQFLDAAALKAGMVHGLTTHWEISKAFVPGGHTDPGPNFPIQEWVRAIQDTISGHTIQLASPKGNAMYQFTNLDNGQEWIALEADGTIHSWWEQPFTTDLGGGGEIIPGGSFQSLGEPKPVGQGIWANAIQNSIYGAFPVVLILGRNGAGDPEWTSHNLNDLRRFLAKK